MDKYAVVTEKPKEGEKTASDKGTCPDCGSELEKGANVPKCPKCGTAPFERDDDKKDNEKENG